MNACDVLHVVALVIFAIMVVAAFAVIIAASLYGLLERLARRESVTPGSSLPTARMVNEYTPKPSRGPTALEAQIAREVQWQSAVRHLRENYRQRMRDHTQDQRRASAPPPRMPVPGDGVSRLG